MILFSYDMAYTMYWKDKSSDSCNEQSACPYNQCIDWIEQWEVTTFFISMKSDFSDKRNQWGSNNKLMSIDFREQCTDEKGYTYLLNTNENKFSPIFLYMYTITVEILQAHCLCLKQLGQIL